MKGRLAGALGKLKDPLQLIITLLISLGAAMIVLAATSREPGKAIGFFFLGPFMNLNNLGNMLNSSIPLVLTGAGIVLAFRASMFNLGGEGQVYTGALMATALCLYLPNGAGFGGILLALLAGSAIGAILGGLSGVLRMRWGTNELLSSFLISASLVLIADYLITGPLDDPSSNLLSTRIIGSQYWLPRVLPQSNLHIGLFIAVAAAALLALLLFNTRLGYELRLSGSNREFARYGGIKVGAYMVLPMLLSGAFHGFAGGLSILGTYHRCIKGFSAGFGWNGIAVALIGRNHPMGVILAALFYAYLEAGARAAMIHSGVSFETATLVQAIVFYLITAQGLISWIPRYGTLHHRVRPPLLGRSQR